MGMAMWVGASAALAVAGWIGGAMLHRGGPKVAQDVGRIELESGVVIVHAPLPGTGWVGLDAQHPIGLIHEPQGAAQAAHLLEHLRCYGATPGYAARSAFEALNVAGAANAETLPDYTHYDTQLPASSLELGVRVEADRLAGLVIDPAMIAEEAARCAGEVAMVESSPMAPMGKFAICAANQFWRYGERVVSVKEGVGRIKQDALARLLSQGYAPGGLVLGVAGDYDPVELEALAREHLGGLAPRKPELPAPIDWKSIPALGEVDWDSSARCVVVAWPPPESAGERLMASVWGTVIASEISNMPAVSGGCSFTLTSSVQWPVGELPFMVCATLREGADAKGVAESIATAVENRAAGRLTDAQAQVGRMILAEMTAPMRMTSDALRAQARQLEAMRPEMKGKGVRMIVGNISLQLAARERLAQRFGQETVKSLQKARAEDLPMLMGTSIAPEHRRIVLIK